VQPGAGRDPSAARRACEGRATTSIDHLLDRNRAFAGTDARRDVPALPFLPRQGLYIVICIDCRVDPAQILGIELGDALVQRNIGGRVTPAVIRDIAYAAYLLETKAPQGPWFEVAVIHHTDCGSVLLADDELRHGYAQRIGADERALADTPVLDPGALGMIKLDEGPGDDRLLWPQFYGLGADVIVLRLEGVPCDDVHSDAQEVFKILEQANVIKKGGTWLEIHEQVQIAVWASLSFGDGAEYRDVVSPALPRGAEDLRAAAAQSAQGQHVIGHASKVSPRTGTTLRTMLHA
jgi:carbonic anhydrase